MGTLKSKRVKCLERVVIIDSGYIFFLGSVTPKNKNQLFVYSVTERTIFKTDFLAIRKSSRKNIFVKF